MQRFGVRIRISVEGGQEHIFDDLYCKIRKRAR